MTPMNVDLVAYFNLGNFFKQLNFLHFNFSKPCWFSSGDSIQTSFEDNEYAAYNKQFWTPKS
jgi:hypothetical protein